MATSVRISGDKIYIGSKQYKRIAAGNRAAALVKSKKAAMGIHAMGIHSALSMNEGSFRNGVGEYVEVLGTESNKQGKVVCNALYDISGKAVGYIRFKRDPGRSDSALRGPLDSFYCLKEANKETHTRFVG